MNNLLAQFAAEGQPVTPDVWDRLEADRRQALEDDLAWIARGRAAGNDMSDKSGERDMSVKGQGAAKRDQAASCLSRPSRPPCQKGVL